MPSNITRFNEPLLPRLWFDLFRMPERSLLEPIVEDEIRVDEFRENGTLVVRAEAPGIDPHKDVSISIDGGRLFIEIERRKETTISEKDYVREEMRYGQFTRSLPLPADCSEKDIKATYHNGILEVRLPLSKGEVKKIPVAVVK